MPGTTRLHTCVCIRTHTSSKILHTVTPKKIRTFFLDFFRYKKFVSLDRRGEVAADDAHGVLELLGHVSCKGTGDRRSLALRECARRLASGVDRGPPWSSHLPQVFPERTEELIRDQST